MLVGAAVPHLPLALREQRGHLGEVQFSRAACRLAVLVVGSAQGVGLRSLASFAASDFQDRVRLLPAYQSFLYVLRGFLLEDVHGKTSPVQIQDNPLDVQRAVEKGPGLPSRNLIARVALVVADVPADGVAARIAFPGPFDSPGATGTDEIQFRVAEKRFEMSTPLLPGKVHLNVGDLEGFHVQRNADVFRPRSRPVQGVSDRVFPVNRFELRRLFAMPGQAQKELALVKILTTFVVLLLM